MHHPIRDWFEQHDGDDGDFSLSPSGYPFTAVPPTDATDTVLYSTKQHPILKLLDDLGDEPRFAAILRYGLPSESDVAWLAATAGSRRLVFLGDTLSPLLAVRSGPPLVILGPPHFSGGQKLGSTRGRRECILVSTSLDLWQFERTAVRYQRFARSQRSRCALLGPSTRVCVTQCGVTIVSRTTLPPVVFGRAVAFAPLGHDAPRRRLAGSQGSRHQRTTTKRGIFGTLPIRREFEQFWNSRWAKCLVFQGSQERRSDKRSDFWNGESCFTHVFQ
jgi:hypothetical protein